MGCAICAECVSSRGAALQASGAKRCMPPKATLTLTRHLGPGALFGIAKNLSPEGAVEVRRARRRLEDTVTDERVGVFTPDKDSGTRRSAARATVLAARRGTVCGEVGRVLRFPSTHGPSPVHGSRLTGAGHGRPCARRLLVRTVRRLLSTATSTHDGRRNARAVVSGVRTSHERAET